MIAATLNRETDDSVIFDVTHDGMALTFHAKKEWVSVSDGKTSVLVETVPFAPKFDIDLTQQDQTSVEAIKIASKPQSI